MHCVNSILYPCGTCKNGAVCAYTFFTGVCIMRQGFVSTFFKFFFLLGFAALLLLYPQESSAAARHGLTICFELIIPSLFPFFVLSSLLVSLGFATLLGRCLSGLMWPLFRLSGPCAAALALGAIGGYPVGARMTAQLYEQGQCSRADALRLSLFCNNCGPAFLFSVAGFGVFGSATVGLLLLGTHLAAAVLVGLFARVWPFPAERLDVKHGAAQAPPFSAAFPDCVRDSFTSTLNVCAFVVLFAVLLRLGECSGLLTFFATVLSHPLPAAFSPNLCQSFIGGFFELSNGVYSLTPLRDTALALPVAAFILGWGGLSVHCQSLPFWKRCLGRLRPYFVGKFLQATLAALLTALLAPHVRAAAAPVLLPLETALAPSAGQLLLQQEMCALFLLAGLYFLLSAKKGLVKQRTLPYNRK